MDNEILLEHLHSAFFAFTIITSICIIILSTPQLIKVLRERRTGNISFLSFWIYHYGIMCWIILSAFAPPTKGGGPLSGYGVTLIAECITIAFDGTLMICLHWFKKEFARKIVYRTIAIIILNWCAAITFLTIHFTLLDARLSGTVVGILGLIFTGIVMLPFIPQFIRSVRTKHWQSVSYWLFALGVLNNLAWICFFGLLISIIMISTGNVNDALMSIGGLIWQCAGFSIFLAQLIFTLKDRYSKKTKNITDTDISNYNLDQIEFITENI